MKNQNQYLTLKIGQGQNYYNKIMFFFNFNEVCTNTFQKIFCYVGKKFNTSIFSKCAEV